jgi:hypothetical protein
MDYRFEHFRRDLLTEDLAFRGGPEPGERVPDFELPTTAGDTIRRADLEGRPTLITFASITDPMTASAGPILKRLYDQYGGLVSFVTVYVREGHPGENYPQADTMDRKVDHARVYQNRDEIPWRVAVDALDGAFHRAMDEKANAAYFLDADGRVVFRSLWSNDERALRRGFDVVLGNAPEDLGQAQPRLIPMLRALGAVDEVLEAAGPDARADLRRAAPPLYAMGRLARLFPGSPLGKGVAATVATFVAGGLLVAGLTRLAGAGRRAAWAAR